MDFRTFCVLLTITKTASRVMKLTTVILFSICLSASASGLSQGISLSEKNVKLDKVFKEIKRQSGYDFLYTNEMLANTTPVTINLKNSSLEEVLEVCFKNQPLTYTIIDRTIVIKVKNDNSKKKDELPLLSTTNLITGRVVNEQGAALAGATVSVKGSKNSVSTNTEGVFSLNVDEGAVLSVSFVGYLGLSVRITKSNGGAMTAVVVSSDRQPSSGSEAPGTSSLVSSSANNLMIRLVPLVSTLDDVQIIAYGTTSRRLATGNVASVKANDIEKQPIQNPLLALQGRVAGLFVTQASGLSGGAVKVRIQGQNSIVNGTDPLYVVDGVPIDAQLPRTGLDYVLSTSGPKGFSGWGNPLSYINPADIESIEVLKDADATAIYGSRAASGAILVTTKKGKAGVLKLDLNMQVGFGKMTRRLNMLNTRQYLDMRYEAFANDGIDWTSPSVSANDLKVWDTTRYTNWQDELLGGTAKYTNLSASVSGGTSTSRYLISGTYHKETTVFPLPDDFADKKGSVHFNIDANSANNKFKLQFSGNFMADNNQLPQSDMTQNALLLEPDAPALLNEDGSINWAPDANGNTTLSDANVMIQRYQKYVNKTYDLVSSLMLGYTILPGLEVRSSMGFNYMQTNDFSPAPLIAVAPELRATTMRSAAFGDRNIKSWTIEPQASYSTAISKGKLELLMGGTFLDKKVNSGYIYGTGQLSDELLEDIQAAANVYTGISANSSYKYNAFFGRVNYNWRDKYILNVNGRRDGSTRFGANNRFHNFGSLGGAWIFSNERLIRDKVSFISFGKLRGSYGTTGNDQIGDYQFLSLYNLYPTPVPYQGGSSLVPGGLPNPYLQWEETRKLQIGIDLGFWQERIVVNTTWVCNRSSNQLLQYELPNITGFGNYYVNFPATIQNRSLELTITGKIIQNKKLGWTSSANLTIPQNKLVSFPNLSSSAYANTLFIGKPVDVVAYYHYIGAAPGTGDYLFAGKDGHPTLAPNPSTDRTTLISRFPQFYGGFQNNLVYKSVQLDMLFQFVKQTGFNDVAFWNGIRYPGMFTRGYSNQPVTVLDRWQKTGDKASVARFQTTEVSSIGASDRRFTDASYIRLKNVSLSWGLPQKWIDKAHFRSFRIYLHGQNLLTITNYKGLDPEGQGIASLPPLRVLTVGVQAGL